MFILPARWFFYLLLACLLTAPGGTIASTEAALLRLEGSTTLLPVVQRLTRAYERSHRGVAFDVRGGGSGVGIQALLASSADIATSSRFLNPVELKQALERGVYPVPFHVAHDAIIPVLHTSNTLLDLSLDDLRRVFLGDVRNWKELGGPDLGIMLVLRDRDSGTLQVWQERVVGEPHPDASVMRVASSSAVVRAVASNRGAIGYIGLAGLSAAVKPLRVDGVIGSLANVRAGRYPLARPLFLFTDGWPEGAALHFINFVLDPESGQREIREAGLLPLYPRDRR